jgi:YD repeat-containing protein
MDIFNGQNQQIASVNNQGNGQQDIYDGSGQRVGYTNANGTFDNSGRCVSPQPNQTGLLIKW